MAELICPRCGAQLLPNDQGVCPICRVPVSRPSAAPPVENALATTAVTTVEIDDPEPLADGPAFPPAEESLYSQVLQILRGPEERSGRGGLWLVLSLVMYVLAGRGKQMPMEAAIVAGVIFFHELGHWLGMKMFGYRDLKIFFIPFFGGAALGKKEGVPQWQQAIVVLLGPLPGIVVGFALAVANLTVHSAAVRQIAWWLLVINGFNLLPLVPLDGGRFLNIVIFSRHRVVEAIFLALTSAGVVALGVGLHAYLLAGLGVFGLLMIHGRFRVAGKASEMRRRWPELPTRIADADDAVLRDLFHECGRLPSGKLIAQPPAVANTMRQVYEQAIVRPVGVLASLALVVAYLAGIAVTFVGVGLMVFDAARAQQGGN